MRLFIDTSGFVTLENGDDENHHPALEYREKIQHGETPFRKLYTSNYILDETLTLLRIRCGYDAAVKFREVIEATKLVTILWIDPPTEKRAWQIFTQHKDKEFSFTDCSSFALMEREQIRTAFTFDKHFLSYGFEKVP